MPRAQSLLVLLAACLIATGCGASPDRSPEQDEATGYADDGTFTIVVADDQGVFDPYRVGIFGHTKLAYDSLVNLDADGEFVSGLAEEWTADANSATFVLRPDVTCSDGTSLTATQVAAAITYVTDPANGSPQYGVNTPTVPVTATGDDTSRTVTVSVAEPFGFLLYTIGQLPIMCARGLADPALLESGSDGTGPFVLIEVVPGQSYTFTRREDYAWGPGGTTTQEPGTPATIVVGYGFYLPSQWIPYSSGAVPPDGVNVAGIDNPDYNALVTQAQTMTAPDSCTYWGQAEQALFRAADIVPIANRSTAFFLQGAEAEIAGFSFPIPTSIRVLE